MAIPLHYTLSNFKSRKLTTAITIAGLALVVFVFSAVLMMAAGVEKTLQATGEPENVKIVRKSANGEISSIIDGETQNIVQTLPHLAKGADGGVLNTREPVVVINLTGEDGGFSNISLRGVSKGFGPMRPNVEIIDGRMFNPDLRELIVGEAIRSRFSEAQVGSTIEFAGNDWLIVGEFSAGGSGFDSELWCDASQMLDAFNRGNSVSTITLKLNQASDFEVFKTAFEKDQRLQQFQAQREQDYYGEQSEGLAGFIRVLGIFVTIIFSIGAMVGAMITMYAAVANRATEIGTLRALGFQRRSILVAFLIEAMIIALAGGLIGVALATLLQFFSISALNFQSFSEIAFSFAMTPGTVMASMIFAIFMGIVGGFLPAVQAARLSIIDALRG